jgi:hypothetical protein
MGISCYCGRDASVEWWYEVHDKPKILETKRSRKCVSCTVRLAFGEETYQIIRWRPPISDVEERIHGDEVLLPSWFFCPICYAIWAALDRVGACVDIGRDDLRDCLKEFNEGYAPMGFSLRIPGLIEASNGD